MMYDCFHARVYVHSAIIWPNSGLSGGSDGTGRVGKGKAAGVLVLLAKEMWLAYR